jgi:hypothetical protein
MIAMLFAIGLTVACGGRGGDDNNVDNSSVVDPNKDPNNDPGPLFSILELAAAEIVLTDIEATDGVIHAIHAINRVAEP